MKVFREYKRLNLTEVAESVRQRWESEKTFELSVEGRKNCPPFVFYEGPPSANGLPGIHHVMARTIKDIFCRYKTQKGFLVQRKAGWDTHGLPVELAVEKELGITKEDIGVKISIADYNRKCREAVMRYTSEWESLTEKMGYWVDMKDPYITFDNKYIESVWWLLRKLYDKGLLYKGYSIQPYSPKAGTGLSSHELNLPGCYRDVQDQTVTAQFKIIKNEQSNFLFENADGDLNTDVYFLAWTTTPWTLPSNTALAVGPNIDYLRVETLNRFTKERNVVLLAKNLLGKHFAPECWVNPDEDWEDEVQKYLDNKRKHPPARKLLSHFKNDENLTANGSNDLNSSNEHELYFKGIELTGLRYEQLLPFAQPMDDPTAAFRVIAGNFVTTEDGTGIVHIAPTFGADDMNVAREAGVPSMLVPDSEGNPTPIVDKQGRFVKQMGPYAGKYVKNEYYPDGDAPEKSVDVELMIQLVEEGKCFSKEKYVHNYPHCWRTDKPVLYYPLDSWFIKSSAIKERMMELNDTINWKPASTGTGRFAEWLKNLH
ncbi:MAG: class I tRNA ligase family protein, partial [Flavobacteriales bacterium]